MVEKLRRRSFACLKDSEMSLYFREISVHGQTEEISLEILQFKMPEQILLLFCKFANDLIKQLY